MKPKNGNIEDLNTLEVIWHLVHRHRVILLLTTNVATLLVWFMQQAPNVVQNLAH